MQMLSSADVGKLLEALGNAGNNEARDTLIADIRQAHAEAVEAGTVTADTPPAAVFLKSELTERGLGTLRASRNGNGPVARVATLPGTDPAQVLIVLNVEDESTESAEDDESTPEDESTE